MDIRYTKEELNKIRENIEAVAEYLKAEYAEKPEVLELTGYITIDNGVTAGIRIYRGRIDFIYGNRSACVSADLDDHFVLKIKMLKHWKDIKRELRYAYKELQQYRDAVTFDFEL